MVSSREFSASAAVRWQVLFLTTVVYSLVHIVAFNVMLLVAAAVCGLFWGWLYQREQSLIPVILSHSIWDVIIFVVFPLS